MMDSEAVRLRNLLGFVERGPLMDAKDESQASDAGEDVADTCWNDGEETIIWGLMLTSYRSLMFYADVAETKEKKSEVKVGDMGCGSLRWPPENK